MPIKTYSTTASSNNASPPNGFPEGMAPASLNDGMRQVMADVRAWYEAPTYIDLGHTPTFVNTTTFTLVGDRTSTYTVGTRLRASGTTPFTVFGTIATSTFSSPNTTITITWDSSAMNSTLNAVAIVNIPDDSIVSSKIRSLAASKITGTLPVANGGTGLTALETTVASASTVDLGAQSAPTVNITGTTTITSFGTVASGTFRNVIFTGILQLTHNATSLILPGGANITTAAGDKLEAISLDSGNWRVIGYQRANGQGLIASQSGLDWLSTQTASNAPQIDFTSLITSTYDTYIIELQDVIPVTDNVDLWIRTSANNGGAYDSGASDYTRTGRANSSGSSATSALSTATAAQIVVAGGLGNVSGEGFSGTVKLFNPLGTTVNKLIKFDGSYTNSTPELVDVNGTGRRSSNAAYNAIRFMMSSGNISSGVFRLYGVRNT